MLGFTVRRVVQSIFVIFGVLVLTFLMTRVVPADPAALWAGPRATVAQRQVARRELGLDKPVYVQLGIYIKDVATGNLGTSLESKRPISSDLATFLPATIELVTVAMFIALAVALPLGVLSVDKQNLWQDHASRVLSAMAIAMPVFWTALMMQSIFYARFNILPIGGEFSETTQLFNPVHRVTGFPLLDAAVTGNWAALGDGLRHILLPALALCGGALGMIQRMTRSAMVEITNEDYITAARSYGLPKSTVLWRYALKNSLGPTATVVALGAGWLLVNTFLVETLFSWPGIGAYIANAAVTLDYPVILGVTLVSAVAYVVLNTVADLIVALDPRVRLN